MSAKIDIFDTNGNLTGSYELKDEYIELEKGTQAVHDVVTAYLCGIRAGTASTKTRSEVSGGGAKPFKQKGTGRARAGSNRSPIWRHGGIIFGPKPRSFAKKVNKKVRKLALKRSFSERVKENSVFIVEKFEFQDAKTKSAVALMKNLKVGKNSLVILGTIAANEKKATSNIKKLVLEKSSDVNTYQMLLYDKVLFTKESFEDFLKRIA